MNRIEADSIPNSRRPASHLRYLMLAAAVATSAAWAVNGECADAADSASPPMVEWVTPALKTVAPQSKADEEQGAKAGRPLAEPEILQPRLDANLPDYKPRTDIQLSGSFSGACSDVLPALVNRWIAGFRQYYPNVDIHVSPPYAGSLGAKELVKQNLDFVFVSRELKPSDVTDFKAKFGYLPLSVPISGGSYRHFGFLDTVGFFVNKDNPIEKLSYTQIDELYSSTHLRGGKQLKTWGDLGLTGDWADKPIHLYALKPWNGFEEFVRQRVLSVNGKRGEWRDDDVHFEKLVFPMAKDVAADPYGIGYSGVAYIDAPVKMLPLAESDSGPYVAPTYDNVALATYPLSRLIYFNFNKAPGKPLDPVIAEFLRYILSRQGQQVVLDHAMYVPLRAGQVDKSRAMLVR
ncbi:PstS family phosphate ABC transporter substrate-binding protein [Paraburkholderia phosphatilytica]|uniref:PstS family phosphate ABC transporter substrate-binding protein n=1 Tax=Paraburkholderia phosphatilytica TaxID=2282883 RepID=UPI001F0C66B6|nr:substrate-binding domain-containing protein [Paraburkholderia phosphatilytica]